MSDLDPFTLQHGATWMDREGDMYVVPGFHEEWIHSHPELAKGARTVNDMVLGRGWVSVVVFSGGYVEICINDVDDARSVALVHELLSLNAEAWSSVLIMPMVQEGFIQIERKDFSDLPSFVRALQTACHPEAGAGEKEA